MRKRPAAPSASQAASPKAGKAKPPRVPKGTRGASSKHDGTDGAPAEEKAPREYPLIQWFPGHIAKAQRELRERLGVVDVVLELVDARIPASSRFAETRALIAQKPSILVLTKTDLAEPAKTKAWLEVFAAQGVRAIALNAQKGQGFEALHAALAERTEAVHAKMRARGRNPRPVRVMVVGLPNVGKSSLINRLAKRRAAVAGDKPGVTRAPSWIRLGKNLELLDTPGIIPPKLEDPIGALRLAMTGSVSSEAYDPVEVARYGIAMLKEVSPGVLKAFGGPEASLEAFARARGLIREGDQPDIERASRTFIHDLRGGALGPVTLDPPPEALSVTELDDDVPPGSPAEG
jgi:ribosome biogenesis GTPase A